METRTAEYRLSNEIRRNLESCILGKQTEIERLLTALLAGGHVLIEDVPGTGKTQLVKALARTIGGQFRRIQCNPDLLPSDITGVSIYHPKNETFLFRPGPIMANLVLVDEINRATTKTQSALLEAMEERHVTVDGDTYGLPVPFTMIATQNPIEFDGTYTLPEAQLDRFMMKISLGYPDAATERQMIVSPNATSPAELLEPVVTAAQVALMMEDVKRVHLDNAVADYIIRIVRGTREHAGVQLGASPRAAISLTAAARAYAYLQERDYVIPDDIKLLASPVLAHRIILHTESRMNGLTTEDVVQAVVRETSVPVRMER
ncbi:MoxR family ATPase [Paenibacillus sp. MWE-103]|uniref:MoxR family ATPase n=1 Tax=Paenibacillus artemisiicola TaxID=1172618 RepID=A0ABS3WE02_9BACL|nr:MULTISPECIES: MoxR family ATPase [Paenibacillus]MBO7746523.1 MoxR family ATPase [Paenibacillus artemisiicola]SFI62794.1 MoxR-like ATPase [Paenibacillus sp. UNC496MF]